MKRGITVAAVLLAAAIICLPWILGSRAQAVYENAVAQLQNQGIRVLDSQYRRGWFTSDATVEIEFPQRPSQAQGAVAAPLRIASQIAHGPWTHGSLRLLPSAALIESRLELLIPELEPAPLLLTTRVELGGGGVTHIRLPEVASQSADLDMEMAEGVGELKFSAGFAAAEGWFEMPSLSLSTPEGGRVDLQNLRAEGSRSRWIAGLNTGELSLTLGRAELKVPDGTLLAVGFTAGGKTIPDGERLNMEMLYRIRELTVNGEAFGASQLSVALRRLPGQALASMRQAMQELTAGPVDESLVAVAMAAIVAEHLPRLLADDPELILDPAEIGTPEGVILGHLSIGSQGLTSEDLETPGGWLQRLVGNGELSMPHPLALQLLQDWHRRQVLVQLQQQGRQSLALPEGLGAEIESAVRDQLDLLVGQGWLVEKDGVLAVELLLEDALLTINGKSIPIGAAVSVP